MSPRETKAQRIEREHAELTERLASLTSAWERERADVRRLEARCSFLYEMAITFAEEGARARLASGNTGPHDGSIPAVQPIAYVAPSTSRRLQRGT